MAPKVAADPPAAASLAAAARPAHPMGAADPPAAASLAAAAPVGALPKAGPAPESAPMQAGPGLRSPPRRNPLTRCSFPHPVRRRPGAGFAIPAWRWKRPAWHQPIVPASGILALRHAGGR
ncbi:MAG: hypothetical protein C0488_08460 [Arthrobacter sp.]|nr:hypothetical protein [Arthrobacter sp.]